MGGFRWVAALVVSALVTLAERPASADSVNSPNITMNVDTNRSAGPGAGNVAVAVGTITVAETTVAEYSAGAGKAIALRVRPGFQLDPTSPIAAQSATFGLNGGGIGAAASVNPSGAADEVVTFALTAGGSGGQDVIRVTGIRVRILGAAGAAGPAQTTLALTTSTAGGAFTDQGIVAATITKGAADRLVFATQPGDNAAGVDLLPAVRIVDFGGNVVTNDPRTIVLGLQVNPGGAALLGINGLPAEDGVATWTAADHLRIATAAAGYTLRASHDGAPFRTSDTADSEPFAITAGAPGHLRIETEPVTTSAGAGLVVAVRAEDDLDNLVTGPPVPVTLDLAENPTDAPLLVGTSLTKATVGGIARWGVDDALRITAVGTGYRLSASGIGAPVETDAFDVVPAAPNAVRYVQQPSKAVAGAVVEPPVRVEIVDEFGNRTRSTADVSLTLFEHACDGGVSGAEAAAVNGVATFPDVRLDTPCDENVLKAASPRLGWDASEPFAVTGTVVPLAIRTATVKPGQLLALVANGPIRLPAPADAPTVAGGTLTVIGTSGSVTHALPAEAWAGLGPARDGSKGFRFAGAVCTVIVKPAVVRARCTRTGDLALPEAGPVRAVLTLGTETRYCGACGGTPKGDPARVFKRKGCPSPARCG